MALGFFGPSPRAQEAGTLVVTVHSEDGPVAQAEVQAGSIKRVTGADGTVTVSLPPGPIDVVVTRTGFDPGAAQVAIRAGMESRVEVALEPQSELEENVIVSATRAEQRIDDVPLRVEVVPEEEVQEKIKGVASALYGMSAIGGVVNLVSGGRAPAHPSASF